MGKLGRKLKRDRAKGARKAPLGFCTAAGCHAKAVTRHECMTCEGLGHEPLVVTPCAAHYEDEVKRIKRHAMLAHPVNLLRATIAGLKGEL